MKTDIVGVFLVSRASDVADDLLVLELTRRGVSFCRLNFDLFPMQMSLALAIAPPNLWIDGQDRTAVLESGARVWCRGIRRRPWFPHDIDQYVDSESSHLLRGLAALSGGFWMNHPLAVDSASNKVHQLVQARRFGLTTPQTLFTNHASYSHVVNQRAVCKPVNGRSVSIEGKLQTMFTAAAPDPADRRMAMPMCIQSRVDGTDVRVTVVGSRVFAATITKGEEGVVDWRTLAEDRVSYAPICLPSKLSDSLLALTAAFNLNYAAIDLMRSDDDWVFIEINPGGQWGWLEKATGLPITNAIADELTAT